MTSLPFLSHATDSTEQRGHLISLHLWRYATVVMQFRKQREISFKWPPFTSQVLYATVNGQRPFDFPSLTDMSCRCGTTRGEKEVTFKYQLNSCFPNIYIKYQYRTDGDIWEYSGMLIFQAEWTWIWKKPIFWCIPSLHKLTELALQLTDDRGDQTDKTSNEVGLIGFIITTQGERN